MSLPEIDLTHQKLMPEVAQYLARVEEKGEKLPLPQLETLPQALLEAANDIAALTGSWNPVEIYTADNVRTEKEKFLRAFDNGEEYNPAFTYAYANKIDLGDSREKLQAILGRIRIHKPVTEEERIARIALYFKIKDDLATCDLVEGIKNNDEEEIGRALQRKYPGSNSVLLGVAYADFDRRTQPQSAEENIHKGRLTPEEVNYLRNRKFTPEEIRDAFIWALTQYKMLRTDENPDGFSVVIDKTVTSIDVRDKSLKGKTVFIPSDRTVDGIKLIKLIGHEIEGHARQSVNGERLFLLGGGRLKIDDETLYEGLAKRYDDALSKELFGTEEEFPVPYYAIAVSRVEEGWSFYKIFSEQLEMHLRVAWKKPRSEALPDTTQIPPAILQKAKDDAFLRTYRVLRGHKDTAHPYPVAMAKDLSYLHGFLDDNQLREAGWGFVDEAVIIGSRGLPLLAYFSISEEQLPIKYDHVAERYWNEILKPQMPTG